MVEKTEEVKQKTEEMVSNDINPYYSNDGLLETTTSRTAYILDKLLGILDKEKGLSYTIGRTLKTENFNVAEVSFPMIAFTGEEIKLTINIKPIDKYGNDGRSMLKESEYNELKTRVTEAGREDLIMKIVEEEDDDGEIKQTMSKL